MAKKSFKDATKNVDRFFSSKNNTEDTNSTSNTVDNDNDYDAVTIFNTDSDDNTDDTVNTFNADNKDNTYYTYRTSDTDNTLYISDTSSTDSTEKTFNDKSKKKTDTKTNKSTKKNKTKLTVNDKINTLSIDSTLNTDSTINTDNACNTLNVDNMNNTLSTDRATFFKFELKMPLKYKEFLLNASWEEKKTITEYINNLIENDIKESHIIPNSIPKKRSIKPIYRLTLKTPYIDYLRNRSFKTKKSVTEYINDLIKTKKEEIEIENK